MRVLWMSYLLFELAAGGPVLNFGPNSPGPNYQPGPQVNNQYSPYPGSAPYNYGKEQYVSYAVPSPEGSSQGLYWWSAPVGSESAPATNQLPQHEGFFSDVSGLDPVYSINTRSRYQNGRTVFAQSRYVPGKPQSVPPLTTFPVFFPAPQPHDFSQPAPQPAAPYPVYTPLQWGFPGSSEKLQLE